MFKSIRIILKAFKTICNFFNYILANYIMYKCAITLILMLAYIKREETNCTYKLSASLSHLSTTRFLHTLKPVRLNLQYFSFLFKKISKNQFNLIYGSDKRAYNNCQLIGEISQNIFVIISNYVALSLFCILHVKQKNPTFTKWFYFTAFSMHLCLFCMPEQCMGYSGTLI